LLLLVNAGDLSLPFLLPAGTWHAVLDTSDPLGHARWHGNGPVSYALAKHSLVLLAAAGVMTQTVRETTTETP
jgi:hypothetical protein